jgi:hypothetical protein
MPALAHVQILHIKRAVAQKPRTDALRAAKPLHVFGLQHPLYEQVLQRRTHAAKTQDVGESVFV